MYTATDILIILKLLGLSPKLHPDHYTRIIKIHRRGCVVGVSQTTPLIRSDHVRAI